MRDELLRLTAIPIDMRFCVVPDPLDPDLPAEPARRRVWLKVDKIDRTHAASAGVEACCASYFSDHALLTTALLPHRV